jgi:hypothetical protein
MGRCLERGVVRRARRMEGNIVGSGAGVYGTTRLKGPRVMQGLWIGN